jgi:hypothetical protein
MCEAPATSKEHVPPACLFPELPIAGVDLRRNLLRVPSCDTHNSHKSKDDEFLRANLVLCCAHASPVASSEFFGKLLRAVSRNPRAYGTFVDDTGIPGPTGSRVLRTDRRRFDRCIEHIVHGVFFYTYRERIRFPVAIVSPNFLSAGMGGGIAIHQPTQSTVDVSRVFLQGEPIQGSNPSVFRYRVRREGTLFAFCAQFYEHLEVYAASTPALADDAA